MSATFDIGIRELNYRSGDGTEVRLLWDERADRVFVTVENEREGHSFRLDVDPSQALDAFHHPFAYAERRRDPDSLLAA
jgi:hypothetical protein